MLGESNACLAWKVNHGPRLEAAAAAAAAARNTNTRGGCCPSGRTRYSINNNAVSPSPNYGPTEAFHLQLFNLPSNSVRHPTLPLSPFHPPCLLAPITNQHSDTLIPPLPVGFLPPCRPSPVSP